MENGANSTATNTNGGSVGGPVASSTWSSDTAAGSSSNPSNASAATTAAAAAAAAASSTATSATIGNHGQTDHPNGDGHDDEDPPSRLPPRPVTPTVEVEELPPPSSSSLLPPARPAKPPGRHPPHRRPHHHPSDDSNRGSKPKQSNLSLLSSTIAYATLERCLLGVNGGILRDDATHAANAAVNYSKQCRAGHVIDILELRRLSSRGVPDEPPELSRGGRWRRGSSGGSDGADGIGDGDGDGNGNGNGVSQRPAMADTAASMSHPTRRDSDDSLQRSANSNSNIKINSNSSSYTASNNNAQSPGGNPHRSYRPLVWRVLLGYLPPNTELWNDVLTRDRKLYRNLVDELFASTCPSPHEVFHDGDDGERENENGRGRDDETNERPHDMDPTNDPPPITPGSSSTPRPTPPPSTPDTAGTTRSTPGLLSARMQQEWIRGEDSIFHSPDDDDNGNDGGMRNTHRPATTKRASPMCAMNVPRVRSTVRTTMATTTTTTSTVTTLPVEGFEPTLAETRAGLARGGGAEETTSGKIKSSLLLPVDDDDDSEHDEGEAQPVRNAVRIDHENAGKEVDEGVELRQIHSSWHVDSSDDEDGPCDHDNHSDNHDNATLPQSPSMDLDEEENMLLLDEIRKDVIRTHPDLRFFLEPKEDLGQKRYAALERILFVWAKLNKGVRYVQGMNEIVGTLYFVLAHDANQDWANEAEADTYFLFNSLMVEMRDVFVPDLDEADTGIHGRISNMISLLSLHDPEVRCHLDNVGIDPSFYSVRWLTTLLSREFLLPDTIRLWDSMFASTHKDNFLRYVSVTMVMVIRDQLLRGDFSTCLRVLQAYPPTNLDRLLESSRALWIYESQITLACHKGGIGLGQALRTISPPPAIIMAYGLRGGIAPQIGEQVRQAGERGLAAARGAANGASHTVANAGRSFFGSALGFWRAGSAESREKKEGSGGGSFRRRAHTDV